MVGTSQQRMREEGTLNAEYISRVNKAFDYIGANLGKPMNLEEIAAVANFSKFHFNRIFHSLVGETPFQFILRLRLEKAASLIVSNKNRPISEIACNCGFSDLSIFSRNFKNYFSVSASQYRKAKLQNSNRSQTDSNTEQPGGTPLIYFCSELQSFKWRTEMKLNKDVAVKEFPKTTVAYVRNLGPYNGDQKMFATLREKLFAWAGARGLWGGNDAKFLVVYHDDPTVAISDNLRMSLCLTVPSETKVDGEIGKMEIDVGRYAVGSFELTGQEFQQAWNWMYGQWLPVSGYQPNDKPYFEMYAGAPVEGNYVVDFCIPVKPI